MADPLAPLLEALKDGRHDDAAPTRLATVTATGATGYAVRFDGETAASTRVYLPLSTVGAVIGDRVLMLRVGSTWVVAAKMGSGFHPRNAIRGTIYQPQAVGSGVWSQVVYPSTTHYLGAPEQGIAYVSASAKWRIDNPGWYRIEFGFGFSNAGLGGARFGAIAVNGVRTTAQGYVAAGGHVHGGLVSDERRIAAGALVDFHVYQDTGQNLALVSGSPGNGNDDRTWYSIRRIDD